MTLLDSQLFQRIDSAELLTWVQEQVPLGFITSIMIIIVTATSFPALYLVGKTNIPYICHFFTRAKFLENKIYTEKTRKLQQNTQ